MSPSTASSARGRLRGGCFRGGAWLRRCGRESGGRQRSGQGVVHAELRGKQVSKNLTDGSLAARDDSRSSRRKDIESIANAVIRDIWHTSCFNMVPSSTCTQSYRLFVASLPDRQTVSRKATMRGSLTAYRNGHLPGCCGRSGKSRSRRAGVDRGRGSGGDVRRARLGALGSVRWTAAPSAMQRRSVTCLSHAGRSIALALAASTVAHAAQSCPCPYPATHATRPVASRRARGTIATNTGIPTCPDPSA